MRSKFKYDDIAIRLYLFALAIITLVPFGRGSISGLEPAIPFIFISFAVVCASETGNCLQPVVRGAHYHL